LGERVFRVGLHPAQQAIFNSAKRFRVCAAGRRFGKTYLAACLLGIEALKEVNERGYTLTAEHGVYYVAPTFDQAKRIMWRRLRMLLGFAAQGGFIKGENINDGFFELINGRRIYIKGADNEDALRGEGYSFVVLDEYADMKSNVWSEIIRPALMDVEGGALFIGTPKGKNHFYKMFIGALEQSKGFEDWEAFHFVSRDNPYLKSTEIVSIQNDPNMSRETLRQELEADFVSGEGKVLNPKNFKIIPVAPTFGSLFVTCDLAGFKTVNQGRKVLRTDESVICVTSVTEDEWTVLDILHGHWGVRETALNIISTCRSYPGCRLGVEQGALLNAVGPYLDEYMRTFGRYITPEPLLHNNQKKYDRILWSLQGRSSRGKIQLVEGEWNNYLLDQIIDFPDPLSHDDAIDALAYVDQLSTANFAEKEDVEEWDDAEMYLH
jgi:Terminase large subunit, T4likevirus-type, N-terminal